jgi:hypothetical protein
MKSTHNTFLKLILACYKILDTRMLFVPQVRINQDHLERGFGLTAACLDISTAHAEYVKQADSSQWYFKVQFLTIIKQNRHYCVSILFYLRNWYMLHVSILLLSHLQAFAIQASVTEINMNLYYAT